MPVGYLYLLLVGFLCWTGNVLAQHTGAKADNSEYRQYKYLADAYFNEGDYEKATRLYRLCTAVPTYEKDAYANDRLAICHRIHNAQMNFDKALKSKPDIKPELQALKQELAKNPKDFTARQRLALQMEQEGDNRLRRGDYEGAMNRFIAIQEIAPTKSVAFKIEKTNALYRQKTQKSLPQYHTYLLNSQKSYLTPQVEQRHISIASQNEYTRYRNEADEALKSENYDLAGRKYIAATQVPGYEGDRYAEEQTIKIARLKTLNKRLSETQNDPRGQLLYIREALSINPDSPTLRNQAAQAATQAGDEMFTKGLFADAKRYYQEAEKYGANGMTEKIAEANTKIQDKRDEIAKNRVALTGGDHPSSLTVEKSTKSSKSHREMPILIGIEAAGGFMVAFPALYNGNINVNTKATVQWYGGGQLIILPNRKLSPILGISYLPVKFQSINTAKTNALEKFELNLLQIPVGLRYNYALSNSDFSAHLEGAATLNLPRKWSYTNYAADVTNTDINALNKKTLGFYAGMGLSKYLTKRRSVSLMFNYRRTNNLLNPDFKDNATNRSRASLLLQGVGIELIFRVF